MTEQNEAENVDIGAHDIRGAVAAALEERDGGQRQTLEAVDDARTAARANADRPDGGTSAAKAGPQSDSPDSEGAEGSKGLHDTAQSTPENGLTPPGRWSASQKEMFKSLPEVAQRFLIERHQAMEADHHRKTQTIAAIRRDHDAIGALFTPYREVMQTRGITPRQVIEYWANTERRLGQGDGIAVIKGIAEGYGIDPAKIAAALGVATQPSEQRNGDRRASDRPQPPRQSPADVEAALAEIARIKERLAAEDRARAEAARAAQEVGRSKRIADIEKFKSEADAHGTLLRPYAAEVEEDMLHLAYVAQARGQDVPPLQELYDRAVRANPSTYQALRLAEQQSAARQIKDEARAKAAAAKRAASSVTGAPGAGPAPLGRSSARSLREEILAHMDTA
jgi:hypothetical protein